MNMKNATRAVVLASLLIMVSAGAAAAATKPFGCRASVARASLGNTTILEPIIANAPTSPCATAGDGVNTASVLNQASPLVNAGPAGVFTFTSDNVPTDAGPVAPAAGALASVDGVTIPTSQGSIVAVGPITAQASYQCMGTTLTSYGHSTLDELKINGQDVSLTPGQDETIQLGGGSYVSVNHQIKTANSLTERILDVHLEGLADIVVGEAKVTLNSSAPCAGNTSTNPPTTTNACPSGSTYDAATQYCVIVEPGGTIIIVGRPFSGPYGGSVLSISAARKLFRSECLAPRGPHYVIVGTNHADRILGTRLGERILGLAGNDRIAGQGGADCIDSGSGTDRVYDGNGNVRAYLGSGNDYASVANGNDYVDGGSGNDRIYGGNGNDRILGGAGNDIISVGRGRDTILGGTGNDRLVVSNGNDTIDGGAGNDGIIAGYGHDRVLGGSGVDKIYAPGQFDAVNCGSGPDLAYVNVFAAGYASRHGCERVGKVHPRTLH